MTLQPMPNINQHEGASHAMAAVEKGNQLPNSGGSVRRSVNSKMGRQLLSGEFHHRQNDWEVSGT